MLVIFNYMKHVKNLQDSKLQAGLVASIHDTAGYLRPVLFRAIILGETKREAHQKLKYNFEIKICFTSNQNVVMWCLENVLVTLFCILCVTFSTY